MATNVSSSGEIMYTVGTRELKDRLTHYLRLVRKGTTLIVTDRGKPVAGLAAEGSISLPQGKGFLKKSPAVRGKGTPLSQVVMEGKR
jgi:antitoxin (DNA-binding transcriptional repressor) of toxin-antitoxin stability system